ncbi:MAG: amidohydrolase [Deltaproteobacteria bacterium]|nr:amidohydrolase [Deltaproteobacteria bacterium]
MNDYAGGEDLAKFMPQGNRTSAIFPALDHLHFQYLRRHSEPMGNPDAKAWDEFLEKSGIECTVVYPSYGLSVGRIVDGEWAIAACRAYNNWLYEKFVNSSSRIKGMALVPVQDVEAACAELSRAVKELGMCGAMLPSNGEGIKGHLGAKAYWPIYEEAEKLNCCLAVHGGCHHDFGMDTFSTYYPIHALGHPFGIMVQAAGMLAHGIFDRFPKIRVAFLEGGATWVPFFLDRIDRSYNRAHLQVDLRGELLVGPRADEKASDYFKRHVREGKIFVGFDCDDSGLGFAVQKTGREPFLFASDFPHEIFDAATCRHEIEELLSREDLTQKDKEAVLGGNAMRLYRLGP